MKANTFRFLQWDYIPTPIESSCGAYKVDVEFTNNHDKTVFLISFKFEGGRIVAAEGWQRSFEAGALSQAQN